MSNELRKNLPDDLVARLEALQKVEEVTEETQVEKNLSKMELPAQVIQPINTQNTQYTCLYIFG